jgi:hypothetical protein
LTKNIAVGIVVYLRPKVRQEIAREYPHNTYQVQLAQQGEDETTSVFAHLEQVHPVQLGNQNPDGKFALRAALQPRYYPVKIVVSVEELFGV